MQSSINHCVRHHTLIEKLTKTLIFNLSSETHSLLLASAYSEQWRMMCAAVFCIWSHLHWEEKKFRTHILLRKAARPIWSVCICIRTALSVFLRSLCVFKILQHDTLIFTRFHWYDLQSHFFSLMLYCLLQTYFTDVFEWHESLISSSDLLFFYS